MQISKLNNKNYFISVIVTVYNGEKYIKENLKSLIAQTYKNWEAIIVDDCSKDSTVKIIESIKDKRIKLIKLKKNLGRKKAVNLALKKSKGNFIAILDSDDISFSTRFEKQIKFFKNNKYAKIVGSWAYKIDYKNKITGKYKGPINIKSVKKKLIFLNFIVFSTIMYNKSYAKKINAIPHKLKYAIDYELYLKFLRYTNIYIIPKYLGSNRFLQNSISNQKKNKELIIRDEIYCLNYVKKNFRLNIFELLKFFFKKLKLNIKLLICIFNF